MTGKHLLLAATIGLSMTAMPALAHHKFIVVNDTRSDIQIRCPAENTGGGAILPGNTARWRCEGGPLILKRLPDPDGTNPAHSFDNGCSNTLVGHKKKKVTLAVSISSQNIGSGENLSLSQFLAQAAGAVADALEEANSPEGGTLTWTEECVSD